MEVLRYGVWKVENRRTPTLARELEAFGCRGPQIRSG